MTRKYTLLSFLVAFQISINVEVTIACETKCPCDCLRAGPPDVWYRKNHDAIEGIACDGTVVEYSRNKLDALNDKTEFVPALSIVTAGLSILSDKWALVSSIVNAGTTLIPLYGGLYAPKPNMRHIGYKICQSLYMLGATAASVYVWANYPVQNEDTISMTNGTGDVAFQAAYTMNLVLTSLATIAPAGNAMIMRMCYSKSKHIEEDSPLHGDNIDDYGTMDLGKLAK